MHRFITLAVIACATAALAQPGWQFQLPQPTGNYLTSVKYLDASHLVAVGQNGTIARSNDGGVSWTVHQEVLSALRDVAFVDANTGIAVGDAGVILRTTDGGAHWRVRPSTIIDDYYGAAFADARTGVVTGTSGSAVRTTDAGETWTTVDGGADIAAFKLTFVNSNTGFIAGVNGVSRSTDAGASWTRLKTPGYWIDTTLRWDTLFAIAFFDANTGIVAGEYGVVSRTTNGGVSWERVLDRGGYDISSIAYLSASTVVMACEVGVEVSTDGGRTFAEPQFNGAFGVATWPGSSAISVGTAFSRSADGVRWTPSSTPYINKWFDDVSFVDGLHGLAVGFTETLTFTGDYTASGVILTTSDGGGHWATIDSGKRGELKSVDFIDPQHAAAVGWNGAIITTTNGGATWTDHVVAGRPNLSNVSFADRNVGCAVGQDWGDTLKGPRAPMLWTTDGGVTWAASQLDSQMEIHGLACFDTRIAVMAAGPKSMRTADGGAHWIPMRDTLNGICAVSLRCGYAIGGDFRHVMRTTDAGAHWSVVGCPVPDTIFTAMGLGWYPLGLNGIAFADSLHGIVKPRSVWQGVLQTSDGGVTWIAHHLTASPFPWSDWRVFYLGGWSATALAYPTIDTAFLVGGQILRNARMTATARFNAVPTIKDFTTVRLGSSRDDSVYVYNSGAAPLIVYDVETSDRTFSVTSHNRVIPPGGGAMFYVSFTPRDITPRAAALAFWHNGAPWPDTVRLMGRGFGGPVFDVRSKSACKIWSSADSVASFDMGSVRIGSRASDSIVVHNLGDENLVITGARYKYDWYFVDSAFVFPMQSAVIGPGDSLMFPVVFAPRGGNFFQGGGDPEDYTGYVEIDNNGIDHANAVCMHAHSFFSLDPRPRLIDYGAVAIDVGKRDSFLLHNYSMRDTVRVDLAANRNSDFQLARFPITLLPGDSAFVMALFLPDSSRSVRDTVVLGQSVDNSLDTIVLAGRGVGPALRLCCNPTNFNPTALGDTSSAVLYLWNFGDQLLRIDSLSITGDPAFTVTPHSAAIDPGAGTNLQLTFRPTFNQPQETATLILFGNMPSWNDTVTLAGWVLTGVHDGSVLPDGAPVIECFPNPATSSITIMHRLRGDNPATLRVLDVMGRCVVGPVDMLRSNAHFVTLSNLNLPDGVYTCELRCGAMRAARMVVVKK